MLLQEQMKQDIFSYNEKTIINFILEKQEQIKDYSTKMIGDETYTAPSTIIRIAHKLGFQGWSDFKEAFLDEVIYLNNNFQEIDPNFPFTNQDTMMQIAHNYILKVLKIRHHLFNMILYKKLCVLWQKQMLLKYLR